MKVNTNAINIYARDIRNSIFRYAYENAEIGKILIKGEAEWFGDIFLTENISTLLHRDIITTLKQKNLFNKIKEDTDKFIILPDVFSELLYPISNYRIKEHDNGSGVKDYGIPNIVLINDHVFEIMDETIKGVKFNYAGKMYYFYDSTKEYSNILEQKPSKMEVICTKKNVDFEYVQGNNIGTIRKGEYVLNIGLDNHIIEDSEEGVSKMSIKVDYPCSIYEYDGDQVFKKMPTAGLYSVNPQDVFVQEKIYDERENKFIMHNRSVVYTETAIVIYKDKSYKILNDSETGLLDRIDKHTIAFEKNIDVTKIIIFYKPIVFDPSIERVDSLYDDVMKISDYGFYALRYYKKNTHYLFNWMKNKSPSIEELVEYGYKYDLDVLYAIQKVFPMHRILNENDLHVKSLKSNISANVSNQLFLNIYNPLGLTPVVFIDGKLFNNDTRSLLNSPDETMLHLNIAKWNPEINNILKTSLNAETDVREAFKSHKIEIAFLDNVEVTSKSLTYPVEYKQTFSKTIPITLISKSEMVHATNSLFFVNGLACLFDGEYCPVLYRQYLYDVGMHDDCKVMLLFNRLKSERTTFKRLNFCTPVINKVYDKTNLGVFNDPGYFSENATLAFNQLGHLVINDINILTVNEACLTDSFKHIADKKIQVSFVRLLRKNTLNELDFEIDRSKIDKAFNVGSYNEMSIERNPDILKYFKQDDIFMTELVPETYSETSSKVAGDMLASFGSVVNIPFNVKDYIKYLDLVGNEIINRIDLMPIKEKIPADVAKFFTVCGFADRVFTSLSSRMQFEKTQMKPKTIDKKIINETEYSPQMQYYINKGLLYGSNTDIILLDNDSQFTYTPEFNNPEPNDVIGPLREQRIELNYGFDKAVQIIEARNITTTK